MARAVCSLKGIRVYRNKRFVSQGEREVRLYGFAM